MLITRVVLPAILLCGAIVRVWGIRFGLPHTHTRPDEEFLIARALVFFGGDYHPHFFLWPSLYFYVTHAAAWVAYGWGALWGHYADVHEFVRAVQDEPASFYLLVRLISAACGVMTIAVVHGLARTLFGGRAAIVSAVFVSLAFLHVRDSHFAMLEVPMALLILLSVRMLVTARRTDRARRLFLAAGICAGLATSIKYNAAAVAVVAPAVAWMRMGRPSASGLRTVLADLGIFTIAMIGAFFAGTPYALLDAPAFLEGIRGQAAHFDQGHGIRIANAWLHHLRFSLRHGLGLPLLVAALAGLAWASWRKPREAILLGAFPILYFAIIGAGQTAFVRYVTPLVPFLCIAAGFGVTALAEFAATDLGPRRRTAIVALLATLTIAPSALKVVQFDRLLTERDTRLLAADWLKPRIREGQTLYESAAAWGSVHLAWSPFWGGYEVVEFDSVAGTFASPGGELPDWIVIADPPPALYADMPYQLRAILPRHYALVKTFTPAEGVERESWFDRQDAFYLPYSRLAQRERPGPQLRIYRRR